jgi:hypothetical protein
MGAKRFHGGRTAPLPQSNYLVPRTDKAWAMGKGTRKARTEPVAKSKARNTEIVMIFALMVISLPGMRWQGP